MLSNRTCYRHKSWRPWLLSHWRSTSNFLKTLWDRADSPDCCG